MTSRLQGAGWKEDFTEKLPQPFNTWLHTTTWTMLEGTTPSGTDPMVHRCSQESSVPHLEKKERK